MKIILAITIIASASTSALQLRGEGHHPDQKRELRSRKLSRKGGGWEDCVNDFSIGTVAKDGLCPTISGEVVDDIRCKYDSIGDIAVYKCVYDRGAFPGLGTDGYDNYPETCCEALVMGSSCPSGDWVLLCQELRGSGPTIARRPRVTPRGGLPVQDSHQVLNMNVAGVKRVEVEDNTILFALNCFA